MLINNSCFVVMKFDGKTKFYFNKETAMEAFSRYLDFPGVYSLHVARGDMYTDTQEQTNETFRLLSKLDDVEENDL